MTVVPTNKISRIRTFQSDMEFARAHQTAVDVPIPTTKPDEQIPTNASVEVSIKKSIQRSEPAVAQKPAPSMPLPTPEAPQRSKEVAQQTKVRELEKKNIPKEEVHKTTGLENVFSEIDVAQKTSILSDNNNEYEGENSLGRGTIIRDTKHNRFRLLPSIIHSITSLVTNRIVAYRNRNPEHTVTKAEARIEVITKAAEHSEFAPHEDFSQVTEHLKSVERIPVKTGIDFIDKSELEAPSWSYTTPEEATLTQQEEQQAEAQEELNQENKKVANAVPVAVNDQSLISEEQRNALAVEHEEKRGHIIDDALTVLFEPSIHAKKIEDAFAHLPNKVGQTSAQEDIPVENKSTPVAEVLEALPQIPEAETETVAREVVAEIPKPFVEVPVLPVQKVVSEIPEEPLMVTAKDNSAKLPIQKSEAVQRTKPSAVVKEVRRFKPTQTDTPSRIYTYVLIAVCLIATISGVGVTYYYYTLSNAPNAVTSYVVPSPLISQKTIPVGLELTAQETLSALKAVVVKENQVVSVYPTVPLSEGGVKPASTSEILTLLALKAPGSFTRSIKEFSFGGIDANTPYIIIVGGSFDTLFAGMLQWEKNLLSDLSPFFENTSSAQLAFTDAIASNKNIRVLTDQNGEDVVIYTFINQNTILITNKREALQTLLPLIK